jgi:hypothetical protein
MTNKWLICTIILLPVLARAESIEEKRARALAESNVAISAKSVNNACQTTIPTTNIIDWDSWRTAIDEKNHHASTLCTSVLTAVQSTCSDKIARETVGRDVHRVVCLGGGSDVTVLLKENVLYVRTGFDEKEPMSKTKKWLAKNLP